MEELENTKPCHNTPSLKSSFFKAPSIPISCLKEPFKTDAGKPTKLSSPEVRNTDNSRGNSIKNRNDSPTAFLFRGAMMQLSTSTEGMYGEISEGCIKLLADEMVSYGLDKDSVFIDLGSGRGTPNIIVAHHHDLFASIGIEKCPQAFHNSLNNMKELLAREKEILISENKSAEIYSPHPSISFANEDLSIYEDFMGATHLYSFDAAMEGQLINNMVYQFMKTSTAWLYASFRSDLISTFGLRNCKLVRKIPVNMMGSGERRTVHFYLKDDWKKANEISKKFIRDEVMKDIKNFETVNTTTHMHISKWNQPLTVIDLIRLSKGALSVQENWIESQLEANSLGILTRSQKVKLWGEKIKEKKKQSLKADKLLEEIAGSKTTTILNSARKRLLALQNERKKHSKIYKFPTTTTAPSDDIVSSEITVTQSTIIASPIKNKQNSAHPHLPDSSPCPNKRMTCKRGKTSPIKNSLLLKNTSILKKSKIN